jgi:hypothetical protein
MRAPLKYTYAPDPHPESRATINDVASAAGQSGPARNSRR